MLKSILILYISLKLIYMYKQVHNQQIALVFQYKALIHVLATVLSIHQGVSVLTDTYSLIKQLVNSKW
jgi:hypothetical protein